MHLQLVTKVIGIALIAGSMLLFSCERTSTKSKTAELSTEDSIEQLETELFAETQTKLDKRKALDLVNLYLQFAEQNPDDLQSPEYLFKASDISMNLNRPRQTIIIFDKILTDYPAFDKNSSAMFLKAFVYEDQLKDYDSARKYYELFLEVYPESEFADDAEVSLQNLGKTPEELIREFEEKNK